MYDINIQKHKDYYKAYYFKTKNMYNQTLFLEIYPERISQKNTMYFVTFTINSKRKQGYVYKAFRFNREKGYKMGAKLKN